MLLWSSLSLLGNYRFSRAPRPPVVERGREKTRRGTGGGGGGGRRKREPCRRRVAKLGNSSLRYAILSSEVARVGAKGFASSGFHPRFFHRVTSAREIRFTSLSARNENPRASKVNDIAPRNEATRSLEVLNINRWIGCCVHVSLHGLCYVCISEENWIVSSVLRDKRASWFF